MPLEVPEIFAQLECPDDSYPKEAILAAVKRREEITPGLLKILEEVAEDVEDYANRDNTFPLTFSLLLLAQFRETRAYPLLVRIFSALGDLPFSLVGDVVTENLGQVLASVCGGDLTGIKSLIENPKANEYVRSAGNTALVCLVNCGELERDEVMAYFGELFETLERSPNYVWSDLACCCADLCPEEHMDQLRRAWDEGLIDPEVIRWPEIEEAKSRGVERCLDWQRRHGPELITDVVRETQWWSCFQRVEPTPPEARGPIAGPPLEPFLRPEPKVGRNDPCPCGSGKKYKKCCGR